MVGKKNKKRLPRQRGSPSQEGLPRSPTRRSLRQTNSPQSGIEENFGNNNVSPNDQSRDTQANQDDASDSVLPGLVVEDNQGVDVQLAQPDFESLDPYLILGVPEQATDRLIKKTYFKLSKQYHPDRLPSLQNQQDAHTTFTLISNAYEFLRDPDKRREHDSTLRSIRTVYNNASNQVNEEDSSSDEDKVYCKCDWEHIVGCNVQHLKPLKCTVIECNKLVHHRCQIVFEQREGFPETKTLKCSLHHPQSPSSVSKPLPVNDPEDKLHSSSASNSKTSMDDSSGHPNDAGKKAADTAGSSSIDKSSSSDDSSDDSGEDLVQSAKTIGSGKDLAFQTRLGQGKQAHVGSPSTDESSEDVSNDCNKGSHSTTTTGRGKILRGKQLHKVLPTAKNRSTKSVPRDGAQCFYFDVFSTYARQQPPEADDFDNIKAAIKSATSNVTSQRSCSKNRMSQLHSEVSSWNTKRQNFPTSSSIFNESIGEDGISSQSTYDVTIDNPHYQEVIAPNPKVLIDLQPNNALMNEYYEILVKAMNDMRIKASSNDTLSAIDRNGRTFNTHIAEMHAASVCSNIDDVEFYEWAKENKFARLWYCHDLRNSEILKLAIEMQSIDLHMIWYKGACFKTRRTNNAISSLDLCHHTQLGK